MKSLSPVQSYPLRQKKKNGQNRLEGGRFKKPWRIRYQRKGNLISYTRIPHFPLYLSHKKSFGHFCEPGLQWKLRRKLSVLGSDVLWTIGPPQTCPTAFRRGKNLSMVLSSNCKGISYRALLNRPPSFNLQLVKGEWGGHSLDGIKLGVSLISWGKTSVLFGTGFLLKDFDWGLSWTKHPCP